MLWKILLGILACSAVHLSMVSFGYAHQWSICLSFAREFSWLPIPIYLFLITSPTEILQKSICKLILIYLYIVCGSSLLISWLLAWSSKFILSSGCSFPQCFLWKTNTCACRWKHTLGPFNTCNPLNFSLGVMDQTWQRKSLKHIL